VVDESDNVLLTANMPTVNHHIVSSSYPAIATRLHQPLEPLANEEAFFAIPILLIMLCQVMKKNNSF